MPRKLLIGPFHLGLESALADEIAAYKCAHGALAPLTVAVRTRLLGLYLRRELAPHINVDFQTLTDLLPQTDRIAPRRGLELLCARIARDVLPRDGYFSPVRETRGFHTALLKTFTDLKEAAIAPDAFCRTAKTKKLKELSAAYAAFCDWLDEHDFQTEADLFYQTPITSHRSPVFLYGFYDLNAAQKHFVQRIAPAVVFFPWTEHSAAYAQPLLDWFKDLGYQPTEPITANREPKTTVLSCPGEAAEVREAPRATLAYLSEHPGSTFNDVAILCRSREQYDALFRDTFRHLGIPTYFRGGRPIGEHLDAKLLRLILETIRSDYSRAAVMELACHLGHPAHRPRSERGWDAESVQLGIVGGKPQWRARCRENTPLRQFVESLFSACDAVPAKSSRPRSERGWQQFVDTILAAWQKFGGQHEPVRKAIQTLSELDEFESPIGFETFADFCVSALDGERESSGPFQGGGVFVGDVMGARGLSWPLVIVLGMVEKSFPRVISEDPLLLDDEREKIGPNLPLKRSGYDEERVLFDLAADCARDQLVLSYPRLEYGTARPRVPSYLLLERTGAKTFKALEGQARRIPLSPVRVETLPLETREFDLPALCETTAETYLSQISPLLPAGLSAARARWRNRKLTAHDGMIASREALELLRERFVLEKLVISATSLEDFFRCPFYYFQKHVLGIKPWEEPEAALTIDAADLGSLYHKILEDYYRQQPGADLGAIMEARFQEFERSGVTGYTAIWEIRKQIIREEVASLIRREKADAAHWQPVEFEREFSDIAVAPPVRLRGKIDRIDRDVDGSRLRVLDYKTGRFKKRLKDDDFARGEALQLALYLLAAEKLFPGKRVESARYLYFTLRGGYRTAVFSRDALTDRQPELNQLLQTVADMVRDGVFAQYAPTKNDPCRACDFRPICSNGIHKLYRLKNKDQRMAAFRAIKEDAS
jgi:ATP-dependent helicase/nuclease subunit B